LPLGLLPLRTRENDQHREHETNSGPGRHSHKAYAKLAGVKIGILGATGPAGRGLAARLASVGIQVYAGSRSQEKAEGVVAELRDRWGERVRGIEPMENAQAAEAGEVVILGTVADATVSTAADHAARLAGKPLVSMANLMQKQGKALVPVLLPEGSVAQAVQAAAPEARVSAALHHVPAAALEDLDRTLAGDVVVVSDHPDVTEVTKTIVEALPGLRALDGGPLANALGLEAFCAVVITVNMRHGGEATLRLRPA
jgi:8-hydroxy-5-deazaflavin:NADPH oxidoreductase